MGRCARIAHVVPQARPFAGAMYAALTASKIATKTHREAPPGQVALKRFAHGARWLVALIRGDEDSPMCLQHAVHPSSRSLPESHFRVLFDASVWGAGAVLVDRHGCPLEFWACEWADREVEAVGVQTGLPAHQTFWELLALICCLLTWGHRLAVEYNLEIVGDNTGSLQCALDQKGRWGYECPRPGALVATSAIPLVFQTWPSANGVKYVGGRSVPPPTWCLYSTGVIPRQALTFTAAQEILDHPFVAGWPEPALTLHRARPVFFPAAVID